MLDSRGRKGTIVEILKLSLNLILPGIYIFILSIVIGGLMPVAGFLDVFLNLCGSEVFFQLGIAEILSHNGWSEEGFFAKWGLYLLRSMSVMAITALALYNIIPSIPALAACLGIICFEALLQVSYSIFLKVPEENNFDEVQKKVSVYPSPEKALEHENQDKIIPIKAQEYKKNGLSIFQITPAEQPQSENDEREKACSSLGK